MSYRELNTTAVATQFSNKTKGEGCVQSVINGSNFVYLWGSIDATNYALVESFTVNLLKILTLPPYVKASGSATDSTTSIGGSTKLLLNDNRIA